VEVKIVWVSGQRYCQMLWISFHSARPWGPTPSANQLCYLQRELTLPI
jgi:hypothetical protein